MVEHQRPVGERHDGELQDLGLEEDVVGALGGPADRVELVDGVVRSQVEADGPAEEVVDVAQPVPS